MWVYAHPYIFLWEVVCLCVCVCVSVLSLSFCRSSSVVVACCCRLSLCCGCFLSSLSLVVVFRRCCLSLSFLVVVLLLSWSSWSVRPVLSCLVLGRCRCFGPWTLVSLHMISHPLHRLYKSPCGIEYAQEAFHASTFTFIDSKQMPYEAIHAQVARLNLVNTHKLLFRFR